MQLRALFVEKTDNPFLQLFRYVFVGGIAAVFDFGTLYLLDEFCRIHHLLAAAVAFLVGVTVNYLISKQFVFTQKKASPGASVAQKTQLCRMGFHRRLRDLIRHLIDKDIVLNGNAFSN